MTDTYQPSLFGFPLEIEIIDDGFEKSIAQYEFTYREETSSMTWQEYRLSRKKMSAMRPLSISLYHLLSRFICPYEPVHMVWFYNSEGIYCFIRNCCSLALGKFSIWVSQKCRFLEKFSNWFTWYDTALSRA